MGGQFLYYIPGDKHPGKMFGADDRSRFGLENILPDKNLGAVDCDGPDGKRGLVVLHKVKGSEQKHRYRKDHQDWVEWGDYWVGLDREFKPEPSDLQRDRLIGGWITRLGDGNGWAIPVAKRHGNVEPFVPVTVSMGRDGQLVRKLHPEFREFVETGDRLLSLWLHAQGWVEEGEEPPEDFTPEERYRIAANALAINYRVSDAEIGLLGLFTQTGGEGFGYDTLSNVHRLIIDVPTIIEVNEAESKKKDETDTQDTGNSGCGSGD